MPETSDANDPTARVTPTGRLLQPTSELPQVGAREDEAWASNSTDTWTGSARPVVATEERVTDERVDDRGGEDRPRRRGRGAGCLFWLAGLVALILVVGIGAKVSGLLPSIHNPFQKKTTDKSQPTLLLSIQDLSRFEAASGNFQVIIDQKESVKYIPDFIYSDRVLFVAAGSVDAYVDFSDIAAGDMKVDQAAKTVELHLPAPQLEAVNLDQDKSEVYDESQGLSNKVHDFFANDPNKLAKFYQLGEDKITQAAKDSDLAARAAENTKKMLDQLLKSLGYTTVTVIFANP